MTVLRYDLLGRLLTFFCCCCWFPSLRGLLSVFSPRGNTSVEEGDYFSRLGDGMLGVLVGGDIEAVLADGRTNFSLGFKSFLVL